MLCAVYDSMCERVVSAQWCVVIRWYVIYSAGAVLRESLGSVDVTADELAQTAGDAREFTGAAPGARERND